MINEQQQQQQEKKSNMSFSVATHKSRENTFEIIRFYKFPGNRIE